MSDRIDSNEEFCRSPLAEDSAALDRIEESIEAGSFLVLDDPGPYPLARYMPLSLAEVYYMLRNKSFNLGTILFDQRERSLHVVVKVKKKYRLDPPSQRVLHFKRSRPSSQ